MKNTWLAPIVSAILPLVACGGSSTNSAEDLSTSAGGDAAMSSFLVVETCKEADYVDARSDATLRTITPWDTSLGLKCVHIGKGQSVTWNGVPNPAHPLEAHGSGTTPTPITNTGTIAFPNAGTFGYDCTNHHTLMHGAVWVD